MAYTSAGDVRLRHLIQLNLDRSDADYGRTMQHRFRGRQANGQEADMASWEVSHEGPSADLKARCRFHIHNGATLQPVYECASGGTVTMYKDLVVNGNLYVQGAQTIINTETVVSKDKNITLGDRPVATTAEQHGGGLTLAGTAPKTWMYSNVANAWTSNVHVNVDTGKAYMINNQIVLQSTGLQLPQVVSLDAGGLWMAGATEADWPTDGSGPGADPEHAAAGLAPRLLLLGPATQEGSWRLVTTPDALSVERFTGTAWEAKLTVRNQVLIP